MTEAKTRSLERIEKKMAGIDEDSIRYRVLKSAKNFKSSWMDLGQSLYQVWKDKPYKDWGYLTFEAYTSKEIGIRKATAIKLLKSYYFLEQEEPSYIQKGADDSSGPAILPSYESVNLLRLAKNKKSLDTGDYTRLKRNILDMGKDASVARKELTGMMRQREELEPEEAREKKRLTVIKRLISSLKTLKTDISISKTLSHKLVTDIDDLIRKIEKEI